MTIVINILKCLGEMKDMEWFHLSENEKQTSI